MHFSNELVAYILIAILLNHIKGRSHWQWIRTGSSDGVVPYRRQAITEPNKNSVY